MSWNESAMADGAGGWGQEQSFATATVDSGAQRIADRVAIPVTVTELTTNTSTDDKYTIGHISFSTVLFIGNVDNIQELEGGTMLEVTVSDPAQPDSTVNVHILRTMDDVDCSNSNVVEGTLIMVVGKPRNSNENTSILVLKTREVSERKEYETYLLECQIAKLYWEKNIAESLRAGAFANLKGCPAGASSAAPVRPGVASSTQQSSVTASQQNRIYNAPPRANTVEGVRRQITEYLRAQNPIVDDAGCNVTDIAKAVGVELPVVQGHLDFLTGEGECFNTVEGFYNVF